MSASKHFENARLADPQAATLVERGVSRLGILEFSAKRDGEGEATLKALLAIHPKHALAHQALAKFYRLRGISEYSAEALIEAGQSLAGEERLRAAIRAYPPEAKRETAAVLRRLAALWETENLNIAAARALRQRAASLDPK